MNYRMKLQSDLHTEIMDSVSLTYRYKNDIAEFQGEIDELKNFFILKCDKPLQGHYTKHNII